MMQWHPGKNLLRVLMQSFSFSMMDMRYVFLGSSAYAVGFKNFVAGVALLVYEMCRL